MSGNSTYSRFLLCHQESDDLFEVFNEEERNENVSTGQVDDVTGNKTMEREFLNLLARKQKICKHTKASLMLDPPPGMIACIKCFWFTPCPHPNISDVEARGMIYFARFVANQAEERDKKRAAEAAAQSISEKVSHVKRAKQSRDHTCHWPGCGKQVPPAMWGCKQHWFKLPKYLRDRVWATYRAGQEETSTPSKAYTHVAREVQDWIDAQVLL